MTQDIKQRVEEALVAAYKMRIRHEYPNATTVPSDEHHRQQAEEFLLYLEPLITELKEREEKLVAALEEFAPMSLLKINLEKDNPDFEYDIYTAGRKQGDTSDMDDEWEYVDFERVDYIEQTLYRRKTQLKAKEA